MGGEWWKRGTGGGSFLSTRTFWWWGAAKPASLRFTAARAGARVLLLEKYGFCGGAAVAGLSGTVCGLYAATEGATKPPEQVVFGFADRFIGVMKEKGGIIEPQRYGNTYTLTHDPLVWREAGDHFLAEAGAHVLFHTTVIDVLTEDEEVRGVLAWTKQSRAEIPAKLTIDASGDADVAALGGFETFMGQDGKVQNPTMLFRVMGVDVERLRARYGSDTIMGDEVSQMIRNLHNHREYDLPRSKIFLFSTPRPNELLLQLHAYHRPRRPRAQSGAGRGHHRSRDPRPQAGSRIYAILQGSAGGLRGIVRQ